MKRNEKIELKKLLLPVVPSLFERDKKEFLSTYPFLEMEDDEIEDDLEIFEADQLKDVFRNHRVYNGSIITTHDEVKIITDYRAHGEESGHGIYLDHRMNWLINRDTAGSGFNLVCYYDTEQKEYLKSLGYKLLYELIY